VPFTYQLGRFCQLSIDGVYAAGVQDVLVHETTTEIDATAFRSSVASSIVTHRTIELEIVFADMTYARLLSENAWRRQGRFMVATVFRVRTANGLKNIDSYFTVSDIQADEPLDGAVLPRVRLREYEAPR
jgi:hypothetical protein